MFQGLKDAHLSLPALEPRVFACVIMLCNSVRAVCVDVLFTQYRRQLPRHTACHKRTFAVVQMVAGLCSTTVSLASNSCQKLDFGRVQVVSKDCPLEVEVRHVELKYVTFFVCSNSDESEDEEHNQTMTHSQKSSGSSTTRHHADWPFCVTLRWT